LHTGLHPQSLATGLDEDYKKPKNLADQIVRLMDDDSVPQDARLRLLMLYILYRGGLLNGDIQKLQAHAQLQLQDRDAIDNLYLLGARVRKPLNDTMPRPESIFPIKAPVGPVEEEVSLSRYEPALRSMVEEQIQGTLDPTIFPPTKPNIEGNGIGFDAAAQQTSLRTANKPTWARTRPVANEQRQRILVFMAGGATYAEARACYQVSLNASKDVFLMTSHMLTPKLFLQQLRGLNADKRRLDIPSERPPRKAPAHLFENPQPQGLPQQQRPQQARQPVQNTAPPAAAMHNMSLNPKPENGRRLNGAFNSSMPSSPAAGQAGKLKKAKDDGEKKKKKKHHFFG
jgi:syntaxin-binding protein 1